MIDVICAIGARTKENMMSFHKIAPVKKTRKPAAPAPAPKKKPVAKKAAPKRRPVAHKG
ncbi:hypothetical protein WKI71_20990 [Streptomyces sp. MS1.AVA.1]|uniref:Uncharacterized protein n=1 Tax=Streptomyces machairae TaxID=3134109 RepID=A0ABU8UM49_9ACTN